MAVTFESFIVANQNWTSIDLYFKTSDTIDELYWYMNGVGNKKEIETGVVDGTLKVVLTKNFGEDITFQLRAVKNGQSFWSKEIVSHTLTGCSHIELRNIDLDNKYISMNIVNPNLSEIELSLSLVCPAVYNGGNVTQDNVITKITTSTGYYVWNLTDDELNSILHTMRYCTSARVFLHEISRIPNRDIQLGSDHAIGEAKLSNDNLIPVIKSVISTRDENTSNIIDLDEYLIQSVSSLNISIPISNIELKGGAELLSIQWRYTLNNSIISEKTEYTNQTLFNKSWTPSNFMKATTFTVEFEVTDSRGLTGLISKDYIVLPYHLPVIYAEIVRPLNSGGIVSINYRASYSRLNINGNNYNSIVSCTYGYAVMPNGGLPSGTIPMPFNITNSANNIDVELNYTSDNWITIDPDLNYKFVFNLQDNIGSKSIYVDLIDGTPIMRMLVNGQIAIGRHVDISDPTTLLFVNSDISGIDIEGKDRKVFETMSNLVIASSKQPENQIIGGVWLEIDD